MSKTRSKPWLLLGLACSTLVLALWQGRLSQAMPLFLSPLPPNTSPCVTVTNGDFVVNVYGYVYGDDGTTTLTFAVKNNGKKDVSHLALSTLNWTRIEPSNGMTYTASLGNYATVWTESSGQPGFASVKYTPLFKGYSKGAQDTFALRVAGFDANATLTVQVKAGTTVVNVTLTLANPTCDKTPPPFSPLPTPTATPQGGAVLPTTPQVAQCVFTPPPGGIPNETIIPLSAYAFSAPQLIDTGTGSVGVQQWLPDSKTLLISRETGISQTVSIDLVDTTTGVRTEIVTPRKYLREPRWLAQDTTVIWRELGSLSDTVPGYWEPGYQLRSLNPLSQKRLSSSGNGASISHDISSNGKEAVFMSLPSGTQPLIWNQGTKTLRALPFDLANWRYKNGPIYPFQPFNVNWQPGGNKLLFWDGTWVFLYDLTTNSGCEIHTRVFDKSNPFILAASWSPNGRYLMMQISQSPPYISTYGPFNRVLILDTYTNKAIQHAMGNAIYAFSWSPNNQTVAFVGKTGDQVRSPEIGIIPKTGIYLLNTHSGEQQQILSSYYVSSIQGIAWSPDGGRLAFLGSPVNDKEFAGLGGVQISQVTMNP